MTNSLRERRKQLLRDEILDAARALLSQRGYAAMSMDDLASQVGISKPTLYSHFPTKDDIVIATVVREMERFSAMIEAHVEGQTPLQRLNVIMQKIIRLHAEKESMEPGSWTPEVFQLICSREDAMSCIRRIDVGIIALVQAGIACGEIDARLDPATVSSAFYALASALRHVRFTRSEPPHPDAGAMLIQMFERGVRAES
jgi:AcrR family transcriptional regulator